MALIWACIIGWLSLAPVYFPPGPEGSDKVEHFLAYALLGLLAGIGRENRRMLIYTLLLIIAYGGLIELIQPYVNRYRELGDLLANGCGAVVGLLTALPLQHRLNSRPLPGIEDEP